MGATQHVKWAFSIGDAKNGESRHDNSIVAYMTMAQDGEIVLSKHNSYNVPGYEFGSSCNGLILESAYSNSKESMPLIITNPVTKQRFTLPPFLPLTTAEESPRFASAIAYASTSMKYKVFATSYVDRKRPELGKFCTVLTVGVDASWRLVDTQHLPATAWSLLSGRPLVTEGFVHWVPLVCVSSGTCILSMNVETESITQIPIPMPESYVPEILHHFFFDVGRSSVVSVVISLDYFKWDVWELKPETGEWKKLPGIDLVARKRWINRRLCEYDGDGRVVDWIPFPVGWLKYPEVIFFTFDKRDYPNRPELSRFRAAYNVRRRRIQIYDISERQVHLVHTHSLVRI